MTLLAGSNFGPYRILEPLGRGGMAAVYRAYEPSLERFVALKVLPAEALDDPTFAERFQREARVIAALEHRNIVPIYAFGIDGGSPWMAMRLVPGGTAASLLRQGPLDKGRALRLLSEVATAIDFAHRRGVLHRDVKPQNVLLDDDGHAYLADFGIARMMEGTSSVTRSGVLTGTPQYMSPEQARGQPIDERCDIYALGIVAYELLTGRVPFTADTPVAVLMKHVMEPIPLPPESLVPRPVLLPILRALAKEPGARWPSAGDFVRALEKAFRGEASVTPAISSSTGARALIRKLRTSTDRQARRWRALLTIALVLAAGSWGARRLTDRKVAPAEPTTAPSPSDPPARPWSPPAGPAPTNRATVPPVRAPAPESGREARLETPHETAEPAPSPMPDTGGRTQPLPPRPELERLSYLVGEWASEVEQKSSPFTKRIPRRGVLTVCKWLDAPRRLFCRSDWGILEEWSVIGFDPESETYSYQDASGDQAEVVVGADSLSVTGERDFRGRPLKWRRSHERVPPDGLRSRVELSSNGRDWLTVAEGDGRRTDQR